MNKTEKEFVETVSEYFSVKDRLTEIRARIKGKPMSKEVTFSLAGIVADAYDCKWYLTNQGGVTFVDDIDNPTNTRRFDALKFWRRMIMGMEQ